MQTIERSGRQEYRRMIPNLSSRVIANATLQVLLSPFTESSIGAGVKTINHDEVEIDSVLFSRDVTMLKYPGTDNVKAAMYLLTPIREQSVDERVESTLTVYVMGGVDKKGKEIVLSASDYGSCTLWRSGRKPLAWVDGDRVPFSAKEQRRVAAVLGINSSTRLF